MQNLISSALTIVVKYNMSTLFFKKLTKYATTPTRGSKESAGLDVYAAYSYVIDPLKREVVDIDIAFGIPEGYYLRVAPRSGLAVTRGVDILAGVVDSDYIGHLRVVLLNTGIDPVQITAGDKIAQVILEKISIPDLIEVTSLEDTERGSKGFGSTGI